MVRSLVVAPLFWGASQSSINAAQKVGGFHFIENKRLFLPGYYVLYNIKVGTILKHLKIFEHFFLTNQILIQIINVIKRQ